MKRKNTIARVEELLEDDEPLAPVQYGSGDKWIVTLYILNIDQSLHNSSFTFVRLVIDGYFWRLMKVQKTIKSNILMNNDRGPISFSCLYSPLK